MKKLAVAGLGLLVLLAVVAPFVTGAITESSWGDLDKAFNKNGGGVATLETVEYDRGYLGTDVLSKLTLTVPEAEEALDVYLRTDIDHGLLGARTETRLDPQRHADWLERFGGKVPVLLSHIDVRGDIEGTLAIPEVAEDLAQVGRLHSHPVALAFSLTDNQSKAHLALDWQGFDITEGESQLRLGKIALKEDLSRLMGELWVGDISLAVAEISSQLPEGGAIRLEDITLVGGTHVTGENRLKNEMNFGIRAIAVDDEPFGDLQMDFVAENFDIKATNETLEAGNRLSEAGRTGGTDSEQAVEQLRLFGEFMSSLRNLMAQGLNLGIPSMVMNTPDGAVKLDFSFVHPELEAGQRENMMSLFQYSEGGLNLRLPSALMDKAPPEFQQQIFQLYQQGLIREENDALLLNIELNRMTLNINGHPIQIPPVI